MTDSGLIATLSTDRPVYAPGDPVNLTLTLRNAASAPVTLEFASAQRYDLTIEDTRAPVWRWSTGQVFAQMLGEETLGAGDSLAYRERFRGQLTAGSYRAVGTVVRMGEPITVTTQFQVR